MSGYGNRTAKDPEFDGHETRFDKHSQHGKAYQGGHEKYGSGATGGAGFGNKSDADPNMEEYDNSDLRFGSSHTTDPYSGHTEHGSGSTGGAGFGNKTGSFGSDKKDSTMGKIMEKVGGMMHKDTLVEKGKDRRASKGYGEEEGESVK